MAGGMNRRPRAVESNRRRHTVEATVVGHIDYTVGRWFWKKIIPSLKVEYSDEVRAKLQSALQAAGHYGLCPRTSIVGYESTSERDAYALDEVVTVHFSTAGEVDQFFNGATAFRWDGIEKLSVPDSKFLASTIEES